MANSVMKQSDRDEACMLQKRVQYEQNRAKRIFNAKQRLYGLDRFALERQISEKHEEHQAEHELESRYEEQTDMMQKVLRAKELEQKDRLKVVQSDLNYYRCRFQPMTMRREFDINDPNILRNSQPVRNSDHDPSLGISSAQIFAGEDLSYADRRRRQTSQQRAWLDQQMKEKRDANQARLKAEKMLLESVMARDRRLEDMANSERKISDQLVDAVRRFNSEMACRKRQEAAIKKRQVREDDLAEINNMLNSDMLTENPDVASSKTNPKKKIAFMLRGMTDEEQKEFRRAQQQQLLEMHNRETDQQLINKQWEQQALNMDRELLLKEVDMDLLRRRDFQKDLDANATLAVEQIARKKEMARTMGVNHLSEEFYDKFNKNTR